MMIFDKNTAENENEETIVSEEIFDDVDESEGDPIARIKKLKEDLKKSNQEKKEYLDGWQRTKADYLNSKKRHEDERTSSKERDMVTLIEKILPLCDSFDMARIHGEGNVEVNVWKTGFAQIHSQLKSILSELKVTEIEAAGHLFDPYMHEALSTANVPQQEEHDKVVSVLQKGYMRGDTVLRPAKVIIGAFKQ